MKKVAALVMIACLMLSTFASCAFSEGTSSSSLNSVSSSHSEVGSSSEHTSKESSSLSQESGSVSSSITQNSEETSSSEEEVKSSSSFTQSSEDSSSDAYSSEEDSSVDSAIDSEDSSSNAQSSEEVTSTDSATSSEEKKVYYRIQFDADGGTEISAVSVLSGEKIPQPTPPTKITHSCEYIFVGWFYNGEAWDFENGIVTQDMTLVAHWEDGEKYTDPFLPKD